MMIVQEFIINHLSLNILNVSTEKHFQRHGVTAHN